MKAKFGVLEFPALDDLWLIAQSRYEFRTIVRRKFK